MPPTIKSTIHHSASDLESFTTHLQKSHRILAVLGAGLSASSGLPTFRGVGGLWRSYDATDLATPEAFRSDPAFVWQFYNYRRHMALNAKPNPAHYALAELARRRPEFWTLSQNVDGLSPRTGHPEGQLKLLHGSLFDVKCEDEESCGYVRKNDFTDPICPALGIPDDAEMRNTAQSRVEPSQALESTTAQKTPLIKGVDISNAEVPLPTVPRSSLPHCPKCKTSLLRPGVVWFGEALPSSVLSDIDAYFDEPDPRVQSAAKTAGKRQTKKIDLCLVIGTSSKVFPAAGYAAMARSKGARVAVVNTDRADARDVQKGDWFFQGDAAEIVPEILRTVVGEVKGGAPGDGDRELV
jgi:NAD+-dependent protein deacetylase sirtuin 5